MPRKPPPEAALYVKLPADAIDRMHRAAEALGLHKKDLVAGLVERYVDPDSPQGLERLEQLSQPRRGPTHDAGGTTMSVGQYSFQPYDAPVLPEVLTVEQAGQLLQVAPNVVLELAESGKLPGRKLGAVWRFSRAALVAWLSG